MNIELVAHDQSLLILVAGELDLSTAPELDRILTRAESAHTDIVLDLDHVSFLDCAGLRVLLKHAGAKTTARRLCLTRGSAQVRRLFELSGVDHLFTFVEA